MKKRQVTNDISEFNKCLGNCLKDIRLSKEIAQIDVAVAIGRQRTYISELETGKHNPTIDTLRLICNYYEIELSELIGSAEKEL